MLVKASTKGRRFSHLTLKKLTGLDRMIGVRFRRQGPVEVSEEVGTKLIEQGFAIDLTPPEVKPKTTPATGRRTAMTERSNK